MFIGYNKARRSGLSGKDFLRGAPLLNPLRIRALRSGRDCLAVRLAGRWARYNDLLPRVSPKGEERATSRERIASREGNFLPRLNVTAHRQLLPVFETS